eukprot:11442936-Alexandrium_andersonii.AAC.1
MVTLVGRHRERRRSTSQALTRSWHWCEALRRRSDRRSSPKSVWTEMAAALTTSLDPTSWVSGQRTLKAATR